MAQTKGSTHTEKNEPILVISPRQSASLIASTLIGVGVLTLPRMTAEDAHEAAWLSTLVGSIGALVAIVVITRLGMRFPRKTIVEYSAIILGSESKMGRIMGKILSFPIIFTLLTFWLLGTASVARTFGEVVVNAVLRRTPLEVIIITMLLIALVLVMYDVEVLARTNEILMPLIVIPVVLIALFSYQSFSIENVLPIWPALSITEFFSGALMTLFAYQGFEIITIFSAHTQVSRKNTKFNMIGLITAALVYLLIVFAGVSVFGDDELSLLMWPTLELVKVTQAPGLVLERMESAFLGVWVAAVFTTTANLYYCATIAASQLLNRRKHRRWFGIAFLPIIFWMSLIPQNILELFEWQTYIGYLGITSGAAFPILLFIIARLRKKGFKTLDESLTTTADKPKMSQEQDNQKEKEGIESENQANAQKDQQQSSQNESSSESTQQQKYKQQSNDKSGEQDEK
ncbi:GerAB/ArcD/ProY family transporter [Caldalkalibacillus salinus]|uniref:GerAB/ArcD/ProY family transporter n=1 Tax=Caldalkalibacillus salinus TaxID=2803787 RepID=UPI001923F423|nr:endospore germination permease [Caldalkalibacillus salinus]